MIKKNLLRKEIVAGVIILFFGASVIPSSVGLIDGLSSGRDLTGERENLGSLENTPVNLNLPEDFLLIPDSDADTVGMYDPYDGTYLGDLIDGSTIFYTPINAIPGPDGNIYVSDQVEDSVFVFDASGNYLSTYADASDGLNNIRGIDFRDDHLFVTSGDDYVAEFDGPHSRLPDFINDGSDPFDILFLDDGRALLSDIQGSTDNIRLYNADGTFSYELFKVAFPEQIQVDTLQPGDYLTASFSDEEIIDFELDGTKVQTTPLGTNGAGVYRLGNGNLLATRYDEGIWEIEPGTGVLIELEKTGRGRFIEYYNTNQPPNVPSDPSPMDGAIDVDVNTDLSWTCSDPDGDDLVYDVYFEADDPDPDVLVSDDQTENTYDPGEMENGVIYYWQIIAKDEHGASTSGPVWHFTTEEAPNNPPDAPTITGKLKGNAGKEYEYTFNAIDPDGDDVRYIIQWGDGKSDTTGYSPSGTDVKVGHTWDSDGDYTIRAYAEDEFGLVGPEGELTVTMPRYKTFSFPVILKILERIVSNFPRLELLLNLF